MIPIKALIRAAAICGACCCLLAAGQTSHPLADNSSVPRAQPLGFAPLDYFDKHCARCHGPSGAFYGESFAKDLSDTDLARIVQEMTEGPGKAPLDQTRLAALIAFHRSLQADKPFIVWTRRSDKGIEGEVTAGSTLKVATPDGVFTAKVTGVSWVLEHPGLDLDKAELTAQIGKRKTTLQLSVSPFSHYKPH